MRIRVDKRTKFLVRLLAIAVLTLTTFVLSACSSCSTQSSTETKVKVRIPVSAKDLDARGTRIPVQVEGKTESGRDVSEQTYVTPDGDGIIVVPGSYEITIIGSPISVNGTIYRYEGTSVAVNISSESLQTNSETSTLTDESSHTNNETILSSGSNYELVYTPQVGSSGSSADMGISMTISGLELSPIAADKVTEEQIAEALSWVEKDPTMEELAPKFREAIENRVVEEEKATADAEYTYDLGNAYFVLPEQLRDEVVMEEMDGGGLGMYSNGETHLHIMNFISGSWEGFRSSEPYEYDLDNGKKLTIDPYDEMTFVCNLSDGEHTLYYLSTSPSTYDLVYQDASILDESARAQSALLGIDYLVSRDGFERSTEVGMEFARTLAEYVTFKEPEITGASDTLTPEEERIAERVDEVLQILYNKSTLDEDAFTSVFERDPYNGRYDSSTLFDVYELLSIDSIEVDAQNNSATVTWTFEYRAHTVGLSEPNGVHTGTQTMVFSDNMKIDNEQDWMYGIEREG